MTLLRAPTRIVLATLDQELRVVLHPEVNVHGPWLTRRVTLCVPPSPRVRLVLDVEPARIEGKLYTLPVLSAGNVRFELRPEQFLCAAAESGRAELTLVLEYLDPTEVP